MQKVNAYDMKFEPIRLKQLMLGCDVTQGVLAEATGLSRAAINLAVNRGYLPATRPDFKGIIEGIVRENHVAAKWLLARGLRMEDIWLPLGSELRKAKPCGMVRRGTATSKANAAGSRGAALIPGDPDQINMTVEVEMISGEAMKHFKLFQNPFIDDIRKDSDIFMSDEHRYIREVMLDAARHSGFVAIIGDCGSGKSVMRRAVVEQLKRDQDVLVIYPQIVDKTRLNASSICDAIVMDISDQKPKIKLEQKTRQVQKLLLDRSQSNYRACVIIEEAHDLNPQTLKYLKRFHELEDGYKKLLGIILIGQTELKHFFNESLHVEMREVIRRCQVAEIRGLNGHMKEYLGLKFRRIGANVDAIFDDGAIEALAKRLTATDRQNKTISHAYPLIVNNYAARAMNLAWEMGEERVTEEVVMAI